jgi:hypothetical protein
MRRPRNHISAGLQGDGGLQVANVCPIRKRHWGLQEKPGNIATGGAESRSAEEWTGYLQKPSLCIRHWAKAGAT